MFSTLPVTLLQYPSITLSNHTGSHDASRGEHTVPGLLLDAGMLPLEHLAAWGLSVLLTPATLSSAVTPSTTTTMVCDPPSLTLPSSIHLESGLVPLVRHALAYSPRFREQCRILAATPNLKATVILSPRETSFRTRARTMMRRGSSGVVVAEVVIKDAADLTELLAHEFEHVIEQLDGVDLNHAAKNGHAHRVDDGAFETARAISAGQQVAGEVLDNAPDRVRGAGIRLWNVVRRSIMRR